MNRLFVLILVSFAMCDFAFAQLPLAELRKIKEIKILESTKEEAIKILAGESITYSDSTDFFYTDFSMANAKVRVFYASGNCAEENEDWNVPSYVVTQINVEPKGYPKIQKAGPEFFKEIGKDFSKLRKERLWGKTKGRYDYQDKFSGISIHTLDNVIKSISFFPSKKNYLKLCNRKEVLKYYSHDSMNRDPRLKNGFFHYNQPANVTALDLDRTEIIADCDSSNAEQNKPNAGAVNKISVVTNAVDPENDPLTYNYSVSAGKIIGEGYRVIWDLSGVKAGTYKITAAVADDCGICGNQITKSVIVKECSESSMK